jgi:hypothetical protein
MVDIELETINPTVDEQGLVTSGTTQCPQCKLPAVMLECQEAKLTWCEVGHVCVIDPRWRGGGTYVALWNFARLP